MVTRKVFFPGILLFILVLALTGAGASAQQPTLSLELSGVNAIDLPRVEVTVNVYDALGQPVNGLTADNFQLSGPLSEVATITRVQNIASNELPFGTVLVIDASESMAGAPLSEAKDAARAFIANIRDIDPVALVAFGSSVQVLQDFTTDRDALLAAIDSIDLLGRTALYQSAYDGINLAKESPVPRRVMILLSDGVEYGGLSTVTPDDVIEDAFLHGVPSYTIGLGYGADRTFLVELANRTNGQFYDLPSPDELETIYRSLADRLSSQYILTLDVNAPLDGTEYPFVLTVESDGATANQLGSVRAPIPVPVVDLSGLPTTPIAEVTDLAIAVKADQDITRVVESLDGTVVAEQTEPPFTLQIDPANFPPGPLTLDVNATDVDGDTGTASITLEVAALPPVISLSRDVSELGAINEPLEITVNAGGQTPITEVRVSLNGGEFVTLDPPYSFTLDPLQLPPGDNHLDVVVINEAGIEATYPADFIIADVPPAVAVEGVSDGQSVSAPLNFRINAAGQTPIRDVVVTLNGIPLEPVDGLYTLDPMTVPPGAAELAIAVTTDRGQSAQAAVTLMIAPLTPIVSVEGLADGQTVTGDLNITIDATAQTPIIHGMVMVNGADVAHPVSAPATITLPFSAMQPGENAVEVLVDTAAGSSGSLSLTFVVPAELFTPTPTNTPTPDRTATAVAAAQAAATRTSVAAAALDAASTQASSTQIAATEGAQSAATQRAQTAVAQALVTAVRATESASTQAAQAQATQASATDAAATRAFVELASTVTAEALAGQTRAAATRTVQTATAQQAATVIQVTQQAQTTATQQAQATQQAATQSAQAQPTEPVATTVAQVATVVPASSTPAPATTAPPTRDMQATVQAAAELVQQAATNARVTVEAQASATAQATIAQAATQAAQATQQAQATQAVAQATQTARTEAANATSTAQARATTQAQTNQTATALAESISTATQQAGRTATQQAAATTAAQVVASATAQAIDSATAVSGTQSASTASALEAGQTATADAGRMAATEGAQITRTARAVLAAQTATAAATAAPTAEVTAEVTAEAQAADATHTPQPTLTPVEVQSQAGDGGATNGLWAVFIVIILLTVALVIGITRARKRRFDQP